MDRRRNSLRGACLLSVLLLFPFGVSTRLLADTIILKNGRRIVAGAVTEEGEKVFYERDGGRVSIPKSLVDRIERGGPLPTRPAPAMNEQAARELSGQVRVPQADAEGIVRNGAVDEERLELLAAMAGQGNLERQNAVNAHMIAASFEAREQRFATAARWAEEAVRLSGRDLNALLLAAQIDIARQQYAEALDHLYVAQNISPDSPLLLTVLGYAYYYFEGPEKALRYWKQAQAIRPDARLEQRIQQVEREAAVEGAFQQAESGHFILSWEGSEVSPAFSREILETLEQAYKDVQWALYYSPRDSVSVILYATQQFADITQSPSWAGALNDGKIRIPVRGLTSMTPGLARILKHEMVHSFVHRLAERRCPTWLNEGLAQLESGESVAQSGPALARLYAQSRQIPLAQLEGSFQNFDSSRAALAYAESLAAVEMLRDRYGAYQLPEFLKSLGRGRTMAESLREVLRMSYEDLETELAQYLATRFGR